MNWDAGGAGLRLSPAPFRLALLWFRLRLWGHEQRGDEEDSTLNLS